MPVSEFPVVRDKLITQTIPAFLTAIAQSVSLEQIQSHSKQMFSRVADVALPGYTVFVKDNQRQNKDDSKEAMDFT
jgi:hypothetical protein